MIDKILIFLLMMSSVFSIDTNCNKLWGMNNEINGVTVSIIGIYMCIDDPLNIYSTTKTTPQNNIILSDKSKDLKILKNDTNNVIIYNSENVTNDRIKKRKIWELLK